MASQITANLPALDFPKEVDYPTQEDWAAFSAAAELNFGILGGDWSTQMQLWKTQANAMSTELNTTATIAQGLANYQGDWTSKGYTLGQIVSVSGIYYICKLNHATGQNPTADGSIYWNLAIGNWNLKVNTDMSGYTAKTTPVDADLIPLSDSAASFGIKKLTWANIKTALDATWILNDTRAKTALNASGTAPIYACRAWVNFNGSGTVAIRASGNVSSITDNGVGNYTVYFTTAMPDVDYSVFSSAGGGLGVVIGGSSTVSPINTSSYNIICFNSTTGNAVDATYLAVQVIK